MFRQVTLDEFKIASLNQKRVVVFQEFPCDDITPTQAFLALDAKEGAVLLESALKNEEDHGRYSLLAIEPFATFRSKGSFSECISKKETLQKKGEPYEHLRKTVQALRLSTASQFPPLVGGAIGFVTYDAVRLFEEIPNRHADHHEIPDLFFLFHTTHITFDHLKGSILISTLVEVSEEIEKDYFQAKQKIEQILKMLKKPLQKPPRHLTHPTGFAVDISDQEFCEKVKKAQEYIHKGDIFQVVLSRTFSCHFEGSPFDVYRALRMTNPSPFMFYMQTRDFAIAGASPERLVKLHQGKLHTMPIAGTLPRIAGEEKRISEQLLQDPKEDAEHMMLVDLGRNDLGIVAKVGSVQVKELKKPRCFPHVIHLVSEIEAEVADSHDAFDVLKAVFPAGTLSGAPKVRAMEIIDELEVSRRGIYGGAICTIDNNGDLDSCIAIRSIFLKDGYAYTRTGAGVIFDSDPQKEMEETHTKAKGAIDAIYLAAEGIL